MRIDSIDDHFYFDTMSRVRKFLNVFATMPSSCDLASAFRLTNIEISEANFLFQVPHFGNHKIILSPTAQVRNLPWTIMIKLNESEDNETNLSMSVLVMCDFNSNSNWWCKTEISLNLLSSNSNLNYRRSFEHCFDRNQCVKGFDPFILWHTLTDPQNGYIEDNKIVLEVTMKCEEPQCVPWNSKKHTTFIGLENLNENSFLNSLIQILYSIESFRTSIHGLNIGHDVQRVIWEVRGLFYKLSVADEPVSTASFVESIKKRDYNVTKTPDSEYFFNFLYKCLQKYPSTKQIWDLFHGQMSILSTSTSQFEITKFRKFNGLQMKICADADLDDLINDHFVSETCVNESASSTHRWYHGLMRCTSTNPINQCYRTEITQLPSILVLHLDRQQDSNDFIIEQRKELKFGMNIDLSKFSKKHIDSRTKYVLHAVLARCDTFSAFVHQIGIGWLKFDNDTISRCTEKEAIGDNFRWVQMLVYLKCNEPSSSINNDDEDDDKAVFNCIICMELRKGSAIFSAICGHVFCERCIKKEVELRQKCPVCQYGLTDRDVHPIYL